MRRKKNEIKLTQNLVDETNQALTTLFFPLALLYLLRQSSLHKEKNYIIQKQIKLLHKTELPQDY